MDNNSKNDISSLNHFNASPNINFNLNLNSNIFNSGSKEISEKKDSFRNNFSLFSLPHKKLQKSSQLNLSDYNPNFENITIQKKKESFSPLKMCLNENKNLPNLNQNEVNAKKCNVYFRKNSNKKTPFKYKSEGYVRPNKMPSNFTKRGKKSSSCVSKESIFTNSKLGKLRSSIKKSNNKFYNSSQISNRRFTNKDPFSYVFKIDKLANSINENFTIEKPERKIFNTINKTFMLLSDLRDNNYRINEIYYKYYIYYKYFYSIICCCKRKSSNYKSLYNYLNKIKLKADLVLNQTQSKLDAENILNKLEQFEKIKSMILTENQQIVFDYLFSIKKEPVNEKPEENGNSTGNNNSPNLLKIKNLNEIQGNTNNNNKISTNKEIQYYKDEYVDFKQFFTKLDYIRENMSSSIDKYLLTSIVYEYNK